MGENPHNRYNFDSRMSFNLIKKSSEKPENTLQMSNRSGQYICSPKIDLNMTYSQVRHLRRSHARRNNAKERLRQAFNGSEAERIAHMIMRNSIKSCRPDTSILSTMTDAVNMIDETFSISVVNAIKMVSDRLTSFALCNVAEGDSCDYCVDSLVLKGALADKLREIDLLFRPYLDLMITAIHRSRTITVDTRPMPYDCSIRDALAIGQAEMNRLIDCHEAIHDLVADNLSISISDERLLTH
jgi:hypothetical protein